MKLFRSRAAVIAAVCSALGFFAAHTQAQTSPSPFTKAYRYDSGRHLVGTISPDPDGSGPLNYPAVRNTYSNGLLVQVETGELTTWQSEAVAPSAWPGFTIFQTKSIAYDDAGRKIKETLSSGGTPYAVTQFSYDVNGRLLCTAVRMNPAVYGSLPSDACALGTPGADGPDRITRNTYDGVGHLTKIQRAYGTTDQQDYATYTYDTSGRQTSVTDANGNYSYYTFDGRSRLQYLYFPSKTTAGQYNTADYEQYGYDANGNRTSLRKRDGRVINYDFDALNRLRAEHYPAGTVSDVYYGYDLRGLELYARNGSDTGRGLTRTYDGFGELKSATSDLSGMARTLNYQYDADGNRTRLTFPDSAYFTYDYDGLDRVTAIKENGSTLVAAVNFDNQGRPKSLTRGGGVTNTSYGYDPVSRLQTLTQDLAGTAYDETRTFGYNPASQIISRGVSSTVYSFTQLPSTTVNYTVNGLNQYTSLTSGASVSPGYDPNGNMTSDGSTTYAYDILNRMTGASGAKTANLAYDPKGRLFQTSGGASGTTQYLYDGDALVAEYNSAGTMLRRYVHGPGADVPLVWYEGSTVGAVNRRYFHADNQGSILAVADSAGNAILTNTYDAYGVPGSANATRFQYTGQIMLQDLGLYYYKARIYNPQLGRFMQVDPIGYKDDVDLYSYVAEDPLNRADPTGLMGTFENEGESDVGSASDILNARELDGSPARFSPERARQTMRLMQERLRSSTVEKAPDATPRNVPKARTGPGLKPPSERDPQRLFTRTQHRSKLAKQGGTCRQCGKPTTEQESDSHHIDRHADGGETKEENQAVVCKPCHRDIHSRLPQEDDLQKYIK